MQKKSNADFFTRIVIRRNRPQKMSYTFHGNANTTRREKRNAKKYVHLLHRWQLPEEPRGSGGYGVILVNISTGELVGKLEGFFSTTNNRMEVMAAIEGLDMVPRGVEVELVSDSHPCTKNGRRHSSCP